MARTLRWLGGLALAAAVISGAFASMPAAGASTAHVTRAEPATAAASVPGRHAPVSLAAVQQRLDSAATRLLAAGGAGNASVVVVPRGRVLRIYWHGRVPANVRALARRVGVRVQFRLAAFTFDRLVAEARRLAGVPGVVSVAPKPDGSGLTVTVTRSPAVMAQVPALLASRIPLTIKHGSRPRLLNGRQADTPPFSGGSRYSTPLGQCTNGFGLEVPNSPKVYEISAGHCGTNGQAVTIPGQPAPAGTVLNQSACRDTLWINYPNGVTGDIYTGAFNSLVTAPVASATSDFVGDLIATGGASSGEHLNIPVQAVDVFIAVGGIACKTVGPLTQAGYAKAQCAVASGDSGGPAYSYSGSGAVIARGTITAGTTAVTAMCPGVTPNGSNTVWYAPLMRPAGDPQIGSLQFYGVAILPG
jgi:hypothetical protein